MRGVPMRIRVFGREIRTVELGWMVHLSDTTVRRGLKHYEGVEGANAAELFLKSHGIEDAAAVERRLRKIRCEHPDYYKEREHPPVFRFAKRAPKAEEPKPAKMTYTQELVALGFEPWPSDYELEARGER